MKEKLDAQKGSGRVVVGWKLKLLFNYAVKALQEDVCPSKSLKKSTHSVLVNASHYYYYCY